MRGSAAFRAAVAPGGVLAGPWVRNELWRAARAVPSLDLRFADNKSLIDATTGAQLITFTRASSGTYVGSDGLIKTATTNLITNSKIIGGTGWSIIAGGGAGSPVVTLNHAVAPDDTQTATKIDFSRVNTAQYCLVAPSSPISATGLTQGSVYVKAATNSDVGKIIDLWQFAQSAVRNRSTATLTNTWQRVSLVNTYSHTGSINEGLSIGLLDNLGGGELNVSVLVWGAQLERSSTVGEYIPTTSTINSAPRFDHNPTTGESLGLLVEEQRTNLQGNSELLTASSWAPSAVTTAVSGTGPNGGTAYEVTETTTTAAHSFAGGGVSVASTTSVTSGSTYTGSIFLKRSTVDWIQLTLGGVGFGTTLYINFNLATGAVGNSSGCTGTITTFANGWYRCTITATASATTSATNNIVVGFVNNTDTTSRLPFYAGSTANKVFATMGQFELGSFATSYIPTTTSTVTRSADVASITGANFSSWYNQTAGTVFAEYRTPASGTRGVVGFNDNTANERIALYTSGTDPKLTVVDGGVTQADINGGTVTASVMTKSAGAFAANDFALAHAGGAAVADTSGTMPTPDRVLIGADQAGNYQNGRIRRLTYWPSRLPDSTLQEITR